MAKPLGAQGRGRDRRAVAAGAVDDRRRGRVELVEVVEQLRERDRPGAGQRPGLRDLAGVADVDDLDVGVVGQPAGDVAGGQPPGGGRPGRGGRRGRARRRRRAPATASNPMRARRTLASVPRPGVAEQHDLLARPDDVAGVLGEPAVEADVDRAPQVAARRTTRAIRVSISAAPVAGRARGPRRGSRTAGGSWSSSSACSRRFASAAKAKYSGATLWPSVTASTNCVVGHRREGVVGAPLLADRRRRPRSRGACRRPTRRRGRGTPAWRRAG